MKNEPVNEPSAAKDRMQDGGKLKARVQVGGKLKAARQKTSLDSKQTTPETTNLSKGDSPKCDIDTSSKECAKKLMEMSKDGKNVKSE